MIKKPTNYDNIEVNEFDFEPIALGGHKGIIKNVEEYKNQATGKESLKVYIDTAPNDSQPNYFTEQWKNDTRVDKKWSNSAIKYVSLGEEETQVRNLKSFLTAIANSNNGYEYDWNKEVNQLKGKNIGLVFGLEEYENQAGELKTVAKLKDFRSIDKVDNVKIPKVKLLDGTLVDYEEYQTLKGNKTSEKHELTDAQIDKLLDGELPF